MVGTSKLKFRINRNIIVIVFMPITKAFSTKCPAKALEYYS
jgi:hypothetical protein